MALRRQTHERIYVDDDLPAFIKAGPSPSVMFHATKQGLLSPNGKEAIAETKRNSTLSNGYRSVEPESEKPIAQHNRSAYQTMSSNKGWDHRFLLIAVGTIIALNIMLYISFNDPFHHIALQRMGGSSALTATRIAPNQTLEDRIVTLRFSPESETVEPATTPAEAKPQHLYVPVIP